MFHMDYSENITQAFQYTTQSSHFNKKQYSLHCTVKHEGDKNHYLYHLSDELAHSFSSTFNVMSQQPPQLLHVKSDSCSMQ